MSDSTADYYLQQQQIMARETDLRRQQERMMMQERQMAQMRMDFAADTARRVQDLRSPVTGFGGGFLGANNIYQTADGGIRRGFVGALGGMSMMGLNTLSGGLFGYNAKYARGYTRDSVVLARNRAFFAANAELGSRLVGNILPLGLQNALGTKDTGASAIGAGAAADLLVNLRGSDDPFAISEKTGQGRGVNPYGTIQKSLDTVSARLSKSSESYRRLSIEEQGALLPTGVQLLNGKDQVALTSNNKEIRAAAEDKLTKLIKGLQDLGDTLHANTEQQKKIYFNSIGLGLSTATTSNVASSIDKSNYQYGVSSSERLAGLQSLVQHAFYRGYNPNSVLYGMMRFQDKIKRAYNEASPEEARKLDNRYFRYLDPQQVAEMSKDTTSAGLERMRTAAIGNFASRVSSQTDEASVNLYDLYALNKSMPIDGKSYSDVLSKAGGVLADDPYALQRAKYDRDLRAEFETESPIFAAELAKKQIEQTFGSTVTGQNKEALIRGAFASLMGINPNDFALVNDLYAQGTNDVLKTQLKSDEIRIDSSRAPLAENTKILSSTNTELKMVNEHLAALRARGNAGVTTDKHLKEYIRYAGDPSYRPKVDDSTPMVGRAESFFKF